MMNRGPSSLGSPRWSTLEPMDSVTPVIYVALGLCAFFGLIIGSIRGRPFLGLVMGTVFSVFGILIVAVLPTKQTGAAAEPDDRFNEFQPRTRFDEEASTQKARQSWENETLASTSSQTSPLTVGPETRMQSRHWGIIALLSLVVAMGTYRWRQYQEQREFDLMVEIVKAQEEAMPPEPTPAEQLAQFHEETEGRFAAFTSQAQFQEFIGAACIFGHLSSMAWLDKKINDSYVTSEQLRSVGVHDLQDYRGFFFATFEVGCPDQWEQFRQRVGAN